jgi:hypothetical protein
VSPRVTLAGSTREQQLERPPFDEHNWLFLRTAELGQRHAPFSWAYVPQRGLRDARAVAHLGRSHRSAGSTIATTRTATTTSISAAGMRTVDSRSSSSTAETRRSCSTSTSTDPSGTSWTSEREEQADDATASETESTTATDGQPRWSPTSPRRSPTRLAPRRGFPRASGRGLGLAFGAFLVGAGIGGGLAIHIRQATLETKYSQIADEEIARCASTTRPRLGPWSPRRRSGRSRTSSRSGDIPLPPPTPVRRWPFSLRAAGRRGEAVRNAGDGGPDDIQGA